jgi:hypothetical protein
MPATYLSATALFRGEAPYLREWLEFHRLVGVERFVLYDNNPQPDGSAEILAPYVAAGIVELIVRRERPAQPAVYRDAVERERGRSRWLAVLDLDEFLFSPTGRRLPEVLRGFERHAAVGACWAVYGTGGHDVRPDGLVTESYLWRSDDDARRNRHVKSIVDPRRAVRPMSPHHFRVRGRFVDERHRLLTGPCIHGAPTRRLLRINHYWSKSREEAERKVRRPRADLDEMRSLELFLNPALNAVYDDAIAGWLPELRDRLEADAESASPRRPSTDAG